MIPFSISRIPAVNVSTVPQRSPLRYPGGKTWLIPHIREWLGQTKTRLLIEPFAGGGTVSLTAVMEDLAEYAIMIEIDRDVAAFWHAALRVGSPLSQWVKDFEPTRQGLRELESQDPLNGDEHGFRTLVLNRTRRGGILAPGASFSRSGENGKGILSRWYPDTLAGRLKGIERYADRISFYEGDGIRLLELLLYGWEQQASVFLDPPYTAGTGKRAGARLYTHAEIDHARLFELLADSSVGFLMTYDCAPEIVDLVRKYGFCAVTVEMKNTHHNRLPELVITRERIFS